MKVMISMEKVFINLHIHTMNDNNDIIENGYIKCINGKITEIGKMSECVQNENVETIDGNNAFAYPGLIDAHTHLGLFEDSLTFEGDDGNEDTDPITPHLRAIDGTNPQDRYFREALLSGVTTTLICPGSTNLIGGQIAAIKTYGERIDKMIIKDPAAIKFSLGENPKSTYNDKEQTPVTRMAAAALIRETLYKAKRYYEDKQAYKKDKDNNDEPEFDMKYEALCPLFSREIPAHFHAHREDDIFTALRICSEFNIRCVIVHGTDAWLINDEIGAECEGILVGPFLTDRSKPELKNLNLKAADILSRKGIPVAIITDHPETPLPFLTLCASVAVKEGMEPDATLRSVTSDAARICGISDRVGSLEVGKDSDIVLVDGDILDLRSKVILVNTGSSVIYNS